MDTLSTIRLLKQLYEIQYNLQRDDFLKIFGGVDTPHLWKRFVIGNHNLLEFFCHLDAPKQTFLSDYIKNKLRHDEFD